MKKITIFAMTEKGYVVVKALHTRHPGIIDTVVASRDSCIAEDYFDQIATFCEKNKIRFYNRQDSYCIGSEYAIAISWRWLIDTGTARLIVLHDSLLPRYRGFNPLVTSLINGDHEIGVTALYATKDYDRGDVIARSASTISYPIRIRDAIKIILANYESLVAQIADCLNLENEPKSTPQAEAEASYSLWRDDEDYFIDWAGPATTIRRFVDAVGFPYKGAASTIDGKVVRVLEAKALDNLTIANRTPGKVIFFHGSKPVVVCGEGLLRIDELVDSSGCSLLPLTRFRSRFKGFAG